MSRWGRGALSATVVEFEDVLKDVEKRLDRVKTVTEKWEKNLQGINETLPSILTTELDITVSEGSFNLAEMAKSTVVETLESVFRYKDYHYFRGNVSEKNQTRSGWSMNMLLYVHMMKTKNMSYCVMR